MSDALYLKALNYGGVPGQPAPTNVTFDDSGDGLAAVFQVNTTDAITHLGFRYGARTGTPPAYVLSLQSVLTASGLPDGTILGAGSPNSVIFTPPADATWDGLWKWQQLANAYTPSNRAELLAACLEYSSGTIDGSNCSSFTRSMSLTTGSGLPYNALKTAGTWAKGGVTSFGYRTANGRYGLIAQLSFVTNTASTNGHRSAMHFTLPSGHGDTFKIAGMGCPHRVPVTGNTFKMGLWDSAGTMIQDVTYDSDQFRGVNTDVQSSELLFDEASLTALNFGTKYYIGFEVASSAPVGVRGVKLAEAADRSAFPLGTNRGYATWDGSSWTDDDTMMPNVELIFADITEPAAGGIKNRAILPSGVGAIG